MEIGSTRKRPPRQRLSSNWNYQMLEVLIPEFRWNAKALILPIMQARSPSVVMNNPSNEFVAKFVGMETVINGKVLECQEECLVVSVMGRELYATGQSVLDQEVQCGIRPENVMVDILGTAGLRDHKNTFEGRIANIFSAYPLCDYFGIISGAAFHKRQSCGKIWPFTIGRVPAVGKTQPCLNL
jgi:hypothetical protein